ncbi:MAG: M20/M25/M40 family metallo-hydrolase [Lentisphaerae bacterium]|nr:M20/M25/M40 family metallo-hydrolase [Lentisphaerota bacterium]
MNMFMHSVLRSIQRVSTGRLRAGAFALVTATMVVSVAQAQETPDLSREIAIAQRHLDARQVQAAMAFVEGQQADQSAVIQDWLGVCNARGPSHDEIFRARHIYKMFRIYGLEQVYIDDLYNVVAVRPGVGSGPTVVLNAHHDDVPIWPKEQPMEAFERDGRIYCQAAGDDIPGVVQLFTVLRAMNEADIQTNGDVWFVTFSGEETGSPGAEHFARAHYPHNLDWRNGDAVVQLHGGGGTGATTGAGPVVIRATLRFFTPFERNIPGQQGADRRWRPHAVDVLARAMIRIRSEVTDPRTDCLRCTGVDAEQGAAEWYINVSQPVGSPVVNRPTSEASVRMDIRAPTWPMLRRLQAEITQIAEETCNELETQGFPPHNYTDRCGHILDINEVYGRDWENNPIPGWDRVDNPQARMVAAAGHVLYGFPPSIDGARGCGDCTNMYKMGLPAFSLRGNVIDYGNGRIETSLPAGRQGGHDVTESMVVPGIWAGIKQAILFSVSHAGMTGVDVPNR